MYFLCTFNICMSFLINRDISTQMIAITMSNQIHLLFPWKQDGFSTRHDSEHTWGCHLHSPMYL